MSSRASPARFDAIDMVKGCAILWVLLIHAHPLGDSHLFFHVVNQAVPIFVVLFGTNSYLWWRRAGRTLAEWYRGRAVRILVPMWAALPVWWAVALWFRPPGVTPTLRLAALHAGGYLVQVGAGWFITMILQLVVVFPLFDAAARRVGVLPVVLCGLACGLVVVALEGRLIGAWGFFNYIVFSPRFFGHVAFGMLLATLLPRLGLATAAASAAAWAACVLVADGALGARLVPFARFLTALPLSALLLSLCARLPRLAGITAALVWLGQSSYGVYLGQLLTHNAFVFGVGYPDLYQRLNLWLYTLILLAGGLFFVALGEGSVRLAGALVHDARPAENASRGGHLGRENP